MLRDEVILVVVMLAVFCIPSSIFYGIQNAEYERQLQQNGCEWVMQDLEGRE